MAKTKIFTADDAREYFTDLLNIEAARFNQLASEAAVGMVRAVAQPDDKLDMGCHSQKATQLRLLSQNHLLRAETFKQAAALIANA